ncbi:hypothetical protein FRC10_009551 [Ceratobasidium sp. 414]|nr:hypothetical protein FRC10_009551 [Ceratobasidium sp. 414]
MSRYTSGFVLTESAVRELCRELTLAYGPTDRTSVPTAQAISRYMASVDPYLKKLALQPVSLQTRSGSKAVWILPTRHSRTPMHVDPETHGNTIRVKKLVMATGIREEHLGMFRTYPNPQRPDTWVKFIF